MTDSGGSYQPKDGEVLAQQSEGGYLMGVLIQRLQDPDRWGSYDDGGLLPPGAKVFHNTSSTPEPVYLPEQIERGAAWIRDHYRDGTFRCPSGDTDGG
jgi:hypothetical protein